MTEGNTRKHFQRNSKYDNVEVQDRVVQLRAIGNSWEKITGILQEELEEPSMSRVATQSIYNKAIARTITTESRAGEKFKDYTKELNNMHGKAIKVLEGYITAAEKVSEELIKMVEAGNITAVKAYGIILKTAPQMRAITSEIRDFMKLQNDQQEKITIEQNAIVWNETQMIDYIGEYLPRLKKDGWTILPPKL